MRIKCSYDLVGIHCTILLAILIRIMFRVVYHPHNSHKYPATIWRYVHRSLCIVILSLLGAYSMVVYNMSMQTISHSLVIFRHTKKRILRRAKERRTERKSLFNNITLLLLIHLFMRSGQIIVRRSDIGPKNERRERERKVERGNGQYNSHEQTNKQTNNRFGNRHYLRSDFFYRWAIRMADQYCRFSPASLLIFSARSLPVTELKSKKK